mmetsp:Transcript_77204/g.218826  ORF Transcript_77204/g.218826 Transcript_77204/m.218826 type:complete len:309 (-) Transcript_77204:1086-2012(-)
MPGVLGVGLPLVARGVLVTARRPPRGHGSLSQLAGAADHFEHLGAAAEERLPRVARAPAAAPDALGLEIPLVARRSPEPLVSRGGVGQVPVVPLELLDVADHLRHLVLPVVVPEAAGEALRLSARGPLAEARARQRFRDGLQDEHRVHVHAQREDEDHGAEPHNVLQRRVAVQELAPGEWHLDGLHVLDLRPQVRAQQLVVQVLREDHDEEQSKPVEYQVQVVGLPQQEDDANDQEHEEHDSAGYDYEEEGHPVHLGDALDLVFDQVVVVRIYFGLDRRLAPPLQRLRGGEGRHEGRLRDNLLEVGEY